MGYTNHLLIEKGVQSKVYVDSCALFAHFLGSPPDERMQTIAKRNGVLFNHEAKLFESAFFQTFQAIFGVTKEIVSHLHAMADTKEEKGKIYLATAFSKKYQGLDIPDPYYLGIKGFEKTWDMIQEVCQSIYQQFIEPSCR